MEGVCHVPARAYGSGKSGSLRPFAFTLVGHGPVERRDDKEGGARHECGVGYNERSRAFLHSKYEAGHASNGACARECVRACACAKVCTCVHVCMCV